MGAPPVQPPRQARSRVTWDRVVDTGVAIIEESGYEGLTIAALCDRAGVTPPAVYRRAPDKRTLEMAIYERALERLEADSTLEEASGVREAVEALAGTFIRNARLLRAIIHRSAVEPEIFMRGSESSTELGRQFRAAVGGDERAADACFRVVLATLTQRVVFGPGFESMISQTPEQLVDVLTEMVEAYLGRR